MFMKQYNYKPRSGSQSSQNGSGGAVAGSPPKEEAKPAGVTAALGGQSANAPQGAVAAGRRRSSASEKFAGLSQMKRGSQDGTQANAQSTWQDQKPGGAGVLGSMWNSFTKGT